MINKETLAKKYHKKNVSTDLQLTSSKLHRNVYIRFQCCWKPRTQKRRAAWMYGAIYWSVSRPKLEKCHLTWRTKKHCYLRIHNGFRPILSFAWVLSVQLNKYETAPYFFLLNQNLACYIVCWFLCFLPEFTWSDPKIVINIKTEQF